jgi:hypothetical protein
MMTSFAVAAVKVKNLVMKYCSVTVLVKTLTTSLTVGFMETV